MYNRYMGNTGVVERVGERESPPKSAAKPSPPPPPRPVRAPAPLSIRPPGPLSGLSGELGRLLSRLSPMKLETDDLLLVLILYLMYRESRDEEFLFIIAALLFL